LVVFLLKKYLGSDKNISFLSKHSSKDTLKTPFNGENTCHRKRHLKGTLKLEKLK